MEARKGNIKDMENTALAFLRRAASVYKPQPNMGEVVLEAHFTDINKTYQMLLGKTSCTVLTEGFRPYTARAEGTYPIFEDLISGRRNPAMALLKGQIKTKGDLRLLKKLEDFFPGLEAEA